MMLVKALVDGDWDLEIQVGNTVYRTREPTLDDVRAMERTSSQAGNQDILNRMIVDAVKPDWDNIGMSAAAVAIAAYEAYMRSYLEKKRAAARAQIAGAA